MKSILILISFLSLPALALTPPSVMNNTNTEKYESAEDEFNRLSRRENRTSWEKRTLEAMERNGLNNNDYRIVFGENDKVYIRSKDIICQLVPGYETVFIRTAGEVSQSKPEYDSFNCLERTKETP